MTDSLALLIISRRSPDSGNSIEDLPVESGVDEVEVDGLSVPVWDLGEAKVLGPGTFEAVVVHWVRGERSMEDVDCKGAAVCSCCQFE